MTDEKTKIQMKEYYREHRTEILARTKEYHATHKNEAQQYCDTHKPQIQAAKQRSYMSHRGSQRFYHRERRAMWKLEVITHYGNGQAKCVRCGYSDIRALTIDHINGGGKKHREQIGANVFYLWLIQNLFPPGFQTLCANCQWLKRAENQETGTANWHTNPEYTRTNQLRLIEAEGLK